MLPPRLRPRAGGRVEHPGGQGPTGRRCRRGLRSGPLRWQPRSGRWGLFSGPRRGSPDAVCNSASEPTPSSLFQRSQDATGTTQQLDSLASLLMYRLAYRNFGDDEALVVTHSVAPGASGGGVRWYEIRNPGGTPVVYQQSTYAPDTKYRWMASAAMDRSGDIGVGYSLSSTSTHPTIAYTGRAASDPLNTLQAETILVSGTLA